MWTLALLFHGSSELVIVRLRVENDVGLVCVRFELKALVAFNIKLGSRGEGGLVSKNNVKMWIHITNLTRKK
jgi:hypothetical protein